MWYSDLGTRPLRIAPAAPSQVSPVTSKLSGSSKPDIAGSGDVPWALWCQVCPSMPYVPLPRAPTWRWPTQLLKEEFTAEAGV